MPTAESTVKHPLIFRSAFVMAAVSSGKYFPHKYLAYMTSPSHIEIILAEEEKTVKREDDGKRGSANVRKSAALKARQERMKAIKAN